MDKKLINKNGYCFKCGGRGFIDKVCDSCGRQPEQKSLNFEFSDDNSDFVKKVNYFGIPEIYQGVIWNSDILKHDKPELEKDYNFQHFLENLNRINNIFSRKTLATKSAIIIAPASFSKMTFAYSCMQRAINNGFTVAPLLDTIEIKRLFWLASENPKYKLYNKIEYDSYVMSDVCFATVTKSSQRSWAYEIIQELIDIRARKGLSTFIISRFDLSEIAQQDKSNSFESLTAINTCDTCKYPAVIRYKSPKRGYDV